MTDTFRKNYTDINEEQAVLIKLIKEKAEELHDLYIFDGKGRDFGLSDKDVDGRHISIAKTELESSVMWAVKGFSKTD